MLETARTGDAWATGEDDMRFQEVMAEMTGMRRVPRMFSSLTTQLRIFVAVLGVRYAYSIPEMCQDDIALFQLIKDRNGAAAVRRWNAKMNAATTYMVQQLNPTKPYLR
jgi:DNA-binding GntR family transcriptional regulator